jgi:negative regulator of flagellin synthesis FlgM
MKIDKTGKPIPAPSVGETTSRNPALRARTSQAKAAPDNGTSVHLGTTTAQLQSMESSIASTPLVNMQKVAEIKQAISEGKFRVDSGVVADRLINSVQDLITASGH